MKSPMGMFLGEEYIVKYQEKSSLFKFFLFSCTSQIDRYLDQIYIFDPRIGTHHRYNITDNCSTLYT